MSPKRNYVGEAPRSGILCALCRSSTTLTKAHVPPRSAGNRSDVRRTRPYVDDSVMKQQSPLEGGMWLRTVCPSCNNLASRYDDSYGNFSQRLSRHLPRHPLSLPTMNGVPPIALAPGRVARSVLHGMVAIAPSFSVVHPEFLDALLADGEGIALPEGLRLRVALTGDRYCRLASAYHMHRVLGERQDYEAFAEIYFRPLAWVLTGGRGTLGDSVFDSEGWGDATDWVRYSRESWRADLRDLVRRLPTVLHPTRRVDRDEWLGLGGPTSYVLEGFQPS